MADLTASATGGFTATVRINEGFQPGPAPLVVVAAGVDLAQATLTITDAPYIGSERSTVTPSAGPVGTRFTGAATGLTPGIAVVAFTTESALGPEEHFRQVATVQVPADGRVTLPIDTTGYDAAGYDLIVFGPGGPAIGLPLTVAQFVVTASAAMPGLPNTGAGGAGRGPQPPARAAFLAAFLLLLAVVALTIGAGHRARRAVPPAARR